MDIATLKKYRWFNLVNDKVVVKATEQGWIVEVINLPETIDPVLRTARGAVKVYKRLDTAAKELAHIGIRQFRVIQGEAS